MSTKESWTVESFAAELGALEKIREACSGRRSWAEVRAIPVRYNARLRHALGHYKRPPTPEQVEWAARHPRGLVSEEICLHPAIRDDREVLDDVFRHEFAHALTPNSRSSHGPEWQAAAVASGAEPTAKASAEESRRFAAGKQARASSAEGQARKARNAKARESRYAREDRRYREFQEEQRLIHLRKVASGEVRRGDSGYGWIYVEPEDRVPVESTQN